MPIKPYSGRSDAKWTKIDEESIAIISELFGAVLHVDQVDTVGEILYDQILRFEKSGSVFLPVSKQLVEKKVVMELPNNEIQTKVWSNYEDCFGLQKVLRPQANDQDTFNRQVHEFFEQIREFRQENSSVTPTQLRDRIQRLCSLLGRESLEVPRGFAKPDQSPEERAADEVLQQIGRAVRRIVNISQMNDNNAQTLQMTNVYWGEIDLSIDPRKDNRLDDRQKKILAPGNLQWFTRWQIAECIQSGKIYDGFTLSAFSMYDAWREEELRRNGYREASSRIVPQ